MSAADDIIDGMLFDGLSEEESVERTFASVQCRTCGEFECEHNKNTLED